MRRSSAARKRRGVVGGVSLNAAVPNKIEGVAAMLPEVLDARDDPDAEAAQAGEHGQAPFAGPTPS